MTTYNMLEAKNNLSKICRMVNNGEEEFVVIASNGQPIAKVVPYNNDSKIKVGLFDKKYEAFKKYDDLFDECNDEIYEMFYGSDD